MKYGSRFDAVYVRIRGRSVTDFMHVYCETSLGGLAVKGLITGEILVAFLLKVCLSAFAFDVGANGVGLGTSRSLNVRGSMIS